jgi:hypothetical protein
MPTTVIDGNSAGLVVASGGGSLTAVKIEAYGQADERARLTLIASDPKNSRTVLMCLDRVAADSLLQASRSGESYEVSTALTPTNLIGAPVAVVDKLTVESVLPGYIFQVTTA